MSILKSFAFVFSVPKHEESTCIGSFTWEFSFFNRFRDFYSEQYKTFYLRQSSPVPENTAMSSLVFELCGIILYFKFSC